MCVGVQVASQGGREGREEGLFRIFGYVGHFGSYDEDGGRAGVSAMKSSHLSKPGMGINWKWKLTVLTILVQFHWQIIKATPHWE